MNLVACIAAAVAVLMIAGVTDARGAVLGFDMGTDTSPNWEGFARVLPSTAYDEAMGYGWETPDAVSGTYREPRGWRRSGDEDRPQPRRNPLTLDGAAGTGETVFRIDVSAGTWNAYVLCGTPERARSQLFDFTLSFGNESRRVQIEGGQTFRPFRLRAETSGVVRIGIAPRNRWCITAVVVWPDSDNTRAEDLIRPIEEWVLRMDPEEWANYEQDPTPEPAPLPDISSADRKRGYLVYARPPVEPVFPYTRPRVDELNPTLDVFASLGEYEPATFTLHALQDVSDIRVDVEGLDALGPSNVDVRCVRYVLARPNYRVVRRYRIVPDNIERFDRLHLGPDDNVRIWITLHVPEDAPPGVHEGAAVVRTSAGDARVPIRLNVLPIHLREDPSRIFGIYYGHPYDRMDRADDDVSKEYFRRMAELEHQDLAAHGIRNVTLSDRSPAADEQGRFDINWDLLAAKLDLWRKYAFRGPVVLSINTEAIYRKHVGSGYGSHLSDIQDPPPAFSTELTDLVRSLEAERRARNWPEFLYYPVDEPGRDPGAIAFMIKVLKACKKAGVRTYLTANPTRREDFAPLKPYVDVWCMQPFAYSPETVKDLEAEGIESWCYPNHVAGENDHTPTLGARMTFGFGFWRSGYRTLIPWIYSWSSGDPDNNLDGYMSDFLNRHEPDGTPIPVGIWEAYREGYDDYRYVYTLESLIRDSESLSDKAARAAVSEAQSVLQSILDAIHVQPKYQYDDLWDPSDFNRRRWNIAQQILNLQELLQ